VAKAAEAAATAAAHAVEAAKAVEAATKDREANGSGAAVAAADAARQAASAAEAANAHAEKAAAMAAASSEPTVLEPSLSAPGDETQELQPTEFNQSPVAEPDDGIESTENTTTLDGDEAGDLLGLDSPNSSTSHVLVRLGVLTIIGAVGSFLISVLPLSVIAAGTALDVIVLITGLGFVVLSIAGVLLLAAAGVIKVVQSSRQARGSVEKEPETPSGQSRHQVQT
jgi:hypothetical protein